VAVVVLFSLPLLPEILGARRLVFRDAQMTHWPWRRVAMASLDSGNVPFVNVMASGGEPLLANPNAGLLYPTVLLEKILSPAAAFNLHYLLHVLWAFFGTRALARRLGLAPGAAFFAGIAFAFSGMMLSYGSAFANSGAAAAWLPWCAAAGLDLVRARGTPRLVRAGCAVALAFGLQLLAGEPAISLLTVLFTAVLGAADVFSAREDRLVRARNLLAGGAVAGLLAAALASALLLPLLAVLPLTYRGQHLYSARAFGASPFAAWRMIEWLFPRFNGDPGALREGAHWQFALENGELVYIWCVTFGVLPLVAILVAGLRREFWTRRAAGLAAGAAISLLFAFGSALPLYRFLYSLGFLRRLRYPIKFYLLTTLCVALLSGLAVERLRPGAPRAGRRAGVALLLVAALYAAAFFLSGSGGVVERAVAPLLAGLAAPATELLPAIRRSLAGDALFGLLAITVLALVLFSRRPIRGQAHLLGLAALLLSFPWALPLFVSADEKDLARPPALIGALKGPGRVFVSTRLPEFNALPRGSAHPTLPPRVVKLARAQIEELIPATGAPFGVAYVFDFDPDGSYGFYNRLADEALAASTPLQASRLLRAYGGRWILDDQGEPHPDLRTVTGFEVAGRRLVLSEIPDPLPELRWAGREHRRNSLSGALDLVRSEEFLAESDVVLPGRENRAPADVPSAGKLSAPRIGADGASADIEAAAPGHVIFSRTYFGAWKARLDNRDVPVLVANARDLAVAVGPGRHRVEFRYDRGPFHKGVAVQAIVFALILGAAAVPARLMSRISQRSQKTVAHQQPHQPGR
jgi:hypothetical protein